MFKQLLLPIIGVAIFIAFVGILVKNPSKLGFSAVPTVSTQATEQQIKIKDIDLKVTIANTPEKRAKGLSGTTSLADDRGMLFIFDAKDVAPTFWMKDMMIPIDIIWINDGKIIQIDKNIAAPVAGTPDSALKLYKSQGKVDYVLEVNSGFSNKNSIQVGDEVTI